MSAPSVTSGCGHGCGQPVMGHKEMDPVNYRSDFIEKAYIMALDVIFLAYFTSEQPGFVLPLYHDVSQRDTEDWSHHKKGPGVRAYDRRQIPRGFRASSPQTCFL